MNDDVEARERNARRRSIDRAFAFYVLISETDRDRMKLNSALLSEAKEMRFSSGADLRSWAMTFGSKLSRMKRACGLCLPRNTTCRHAAALLMAARLHNAINSARVTASVYDRQLGSVTSRRRMTTRAIETAKAARSNARRFEDQAVEQLRSLVHQSDFLDAHDLFALACGDTLSYCIRDDAEALTGV